MSKFIFLAFNLFKVLSITVNVFKPSKSNFTKPAFSEECMSNCVDGSIKLEDLSLYKGNVTILGRSSEFSLYDSKIVTFEDDENAYNQADATGFIKINSLRLKQFARRKRKISQ